MPAEFWRENVPNAQWYDGEQEVCVVFFLNTRRQIIGFSRIASGTMDSISLHPRDVFKLAIVQGAAAIIIGHNHPSGNPSPSKLDIKFTRDIIRAGPIPVSHCTAHFS